MGQPHLDPGFYLLLGSLALAVFVQCAVVSFFFGRLFERQAVANRRIDKIEKDLAADGASETSIAVNLATLTADMGHLVADVADIKKRFGWMGSIAGAPG